MYDLKKVSLYLYFVTLGMVTIIGLYNSKILVPQGKTSLSFLFDAIDAVANMKDNINSSVYYHFFSV